jgi:serine/threonine protein kinase
MQELLGGRYRLIDQLGAGGMAEVWRARDSESGEIVAVKRLHAHLRADADAARRFAREAESAARIDHPQAVRIRDVGNDPDDAYIVMDYVAGPSLAERLDADGPMEPAAAVRIAREVSDALAAAHRQGIVHRDVKPANILLDPDRGARLADFGIARALDDRGVTMTGNVIGTLRYMPPEAMAGEPPTPASDVWGIGAVLFEMLSGGPLREDTSPASLIEARTRMPPAIAGLNPDTARVLEALVSPDPAARPPDGGAASAALRALEGRGSVPPSLLAASDLTAVTELVTVSTRGRQRPSRTLAAVAALGLGAVALTALATGLGWQPGDGDVGAAPPATDRPALAPETPVPPTDAPVDVQADAPGEAEPAAIPAAPPKPQKDKDKDKPDKGKSDKGKSDKQAGNARDQNDKGKGKGKGRSDGGKGKGKDKGKGKSG